MKKLTFIIALFLSINASATSLNIWFVENDSATIGQSFTVSVKGSYSAVSDTGRLYIKDLSSGIFQEVYKYRIIDLPNLPAGASGTRLFIFNIPAGYTDDCELFTNYQVTARTPIVIYAPLAVLNRTYYENIGDIYYYNIQGIEIKKPNQGFFIWKSSLGVSGKEFIE